MDNDNNNTFNQKMIGPNNINIRSDNNFVYQYKRDIPNINNNQKFMDNYRDNSNDNIIQNNYTKNSFEDNKENNENFNINNSYENLRNKKNQQEKDLNRKKNEYEEDQFIDYLKQAMLLESKIESLKIDLSLRSDFNWEQVFRIFELEGRGFLEKEDLNTGFNKFDLRPKDLDIALLLKRYDLKKEGHISYPNFFELIVPFSKSHRMMVDKRKINDESGSVLYNPNEFSPETLKCIKNLFVNIFNGEFILNKMRESFTNLKIKFSDIFHLLDPEGNGFVDEKGLLYFMKKNGVFSSNNDCDLLFWRLNKLRNGKIDFQEMCEEIEAVYQ
jgi:Ca2+-binding EF-hand superfamily protein